MTEHKNGKPHNTYGTVTDLTHVDDSAFDLAIHKAIHHHLLARGMPELTLGLLAYSLGRIQASLVYGGASSDTVSLVSAENMKLGFQGRVSEIKAEIAAAEAQAAREKDGKTEH